MKVVLLPDGDDPDSFSRKHTLQEVKDFIAENEKDCIEFKTDWLLAEAGGDPLKKAGVISAVADTIAAIPDAIKRSTYSEIFSQRMGVSKEEIVQARVRTTRAKNMEEEQKRQAREAGQPLAGGRVKVDRTEKEKPYLIEDKILAPIEAEILGFMLKDGDKTVLDEDRSIPLPDYIAEIIEITGKPFANSVYRRLYDSYMELYDSLMPEFDPEEDPKTREEAQQEIIRRLLNSPDTQLNLAAQDLAFDRYKITYKKLSGSMRATDDWLRNAVPKSLFTLVERRYNSEIDACRRKMAQAPAEEQLQLMEELKNLLDQRNRIRNNIKEKTR